MASDLREALSQAITFGIFDLAAKIGGGHFVSFIHHDQVPIYLGEFFLRVFVSGKFVEAGDHQRHFQEDITGAGRFNAIISEELKRQLKTLPKFVLPLFSKIARADDKATLKVATDHQFFDVKPGHDGFSGPRVIRQEKAQGLAGQHLFVNRGDLVRKRINHRGVHGKVGVKEISQANALGLGNKPQELPVGLKTPGLSLGNQLKPFFIASEEELVSNPTGGVFVGEFNGIGSIPLHIDYCDVLSRKDTPDGGSLLKILKLGHWILSSLVRLVTIIKTIIPKI